MFRLFLCVPLWPSVVTGPRLLNSLDRAAEQPSYGPATPAGVVSRIARIRGGIGTAKAVPRPLALSPQSKGDSHPDLLQISVSLCGPLWFIFLAKISH